jgi:hypothetical protein
MEGGYISDFMDRYARGIPDNGYGADIVQMGNRKNMVP